jgi:hypothetical protein
VSDENRYVTEARKAETDLVAIERTNKRQVETKNNMIRRTLTSILSESSRPPVKTLNTALRINNILPANTSHSQSEAHSSHTEHYQPSTNFSLSVRICMSNMATGSVDSGSSAGVVRWVAMEAVWLGI